MTETDSTAWELIEGAAQGDIDARQRFAVRYQALVRAWLSARWRASPHEARLEDAVQDVFVECLKQQGALQAADRAREGGFRVFLRGVVRNVARRHEDLGRKERRRQQPIGSQLDGVPADQTSLSGQMDRELAQALVREAGRLLAERAARLGGSARLRIDLLRLRFHDDLPIRAIAERWGMDAAAVHHQYGRARREFRRMLEDVVARRFPGPEDEVAARCDRLMDLL